MLPNPADPTNNKATDAIKNESVSFVVTVRKPTTRPNTTNNKVKASPVIKPAPCNNPSTIASNTPARNAHSPYLALVTISPLKLFGKLLIKYDFPLIRNNIWNQQTFIFFVLQFVVMIPGMDPKKLEQALKQLGMKMEDVQANQVIIKTDTGDITIDKPQVIKTTMRGQVVYQVSGEIKEQSFSEDDIKLVMNQTGIKDEKKIKKALEETKGDVVEAIMKLKSS